MVQRITLSQPINVELRLTVGAAITLKERSLLDVFALPGSAEEFARIIEDADLFPRVLWHMTDQTTDLAMFRLLVAASDRESLWEAFRDEVLDFFQDPIREQIVALANSISEHSNANRNYQTQSEPPSDESPSTEHGTDFGNSPGSSASILAASPIVSWSGWPEVESVPIGHAQVG